MPRLSAKSLRSGQIPASPSRHNEISAVTLQLLLIPQHLLHHLRLHFPTAEQAGQLGLNPQQLHSKSHFCTPAPHQTQNDRGWGLIWLCWPWQRHSDNIFLLYLILRLYSRRPAQQMFLRGELLRGTAV